MPEFDIPKSCPACGFGGLLPKYIRQPWFVHLLLSKKRWAEDFMLVKCTQCDYEFAVGKGKHDA